MLLLWVGRVNLSTHSAAHWIQRIKTTALMSSRKTPSSRKPPKRRRRPAWTVVQCPVRTRGEGAWIKASSGTCDQQLLCTLNEWSVESNEFVAYSLPPSTSNRDPTAVIVCPTRPEGGVPACGMRKRGSQRTRVMLPCCRTTSSPLPASVPSVPHLHTFKVIDENASPNLLQPKPSSNPNHLLTLSLYSVPNAPCNLEMPKIVERGFGRVAAENIHRAPNSARAVPTPLGWSANAAHNL
mmetsp:Transcript_48884/g.110003  ORF Transcript_48884/g.110003 Transcript_48884/m.110003 type:complete len:239 (+) Transcript_48884:108-824(+)